MGSFLVERKRVRMAVAEWLDVLVQVVFARFCYGGNLNLAVEIWTNGIAQAYGFSFERENGRGNVH